jgi:hypothetical protein
MIYTFDDFNGFMAGEAFNADGVWEDSGWVLVQDGTPTGDLVSMNSAPTNTSDFDSCIRIEPGTDGDQGGNMQLDATNGTFIGGTYLFPHIWIPDSVTVPSGSTATGAALTALDDSTWVFACRIGLRADVTTTGDGDFDGKVFIGWAEAADSSILTETGVTMATPIITLTETGPLVGFVIPEDGSINGVSQRTPGTAYAEGTNFTKLVDAGGVDGTVANGAKVLADTMWFDLALRMDITDMSDDAANGSTRFFSRGPLNRTSPANAGKDEFAQPGKGYEPWQEHGTVLTHQTPNNNERLVPTIEVIDGPSAGVDMVFYLDWWTMGRSRVSR